MEWSTDVTQAQWWVDRLGPWDHTVDGLHHVVPGGFESVTRIFHPVEFDNGETSTWAEVAASNGRIPHPEMQLHAIGTPSGTPPDLDAYAGPYARVGELPEVEMRILAGELANWTASPDDCWFGVWEGYGQLHRGGQVHTYSRSGRWGRNPEPIAGLAPERVRNGDRVHTDARDYFVLHGPLSEIDDAARLIGGQSPNLWWPADRSWFVASEIDFAWTYVAGSRALVEALQRVDGLEVLQSSYAHGCTIHADTINR